MNRTLSSLPKYYSLVVLSSGDIFSINVEGVTPNNMLYSLVGGRLFVIECLSSYQKNIHWPDTKTNREDK